MINSLFFVTSNSNKFLEVESILKKRLNSTKLRFYKYHIIEIQSDDIEMIALEKARYAYDMVKQPIIIEDDGLFIKSLNGFPGQYSSYSFATIGNRGILKLMKGESDRYAFFISIFVYNDGTEIELFSGEICGKISTRLCRRVWGFDTIFIPEKSNMSLGRLYIINKKNMFSHRRLTLEKFILWYNGKYGQYSIKYFEFIIL